MDDADILQGLLNRDPNAWLEFTNKYSELLVVYLLRQFHFLSEADAIIIADQVLDKLVTAPGLIDDTRGTLGSLAYTMARNKALDLHRARAKRITLRIQEHDYEHEPALAEDDPADDSGRSVEEWFPLEVLGEAKEIVAGLTEKERWHLDLRVRTPALKGTEIADMLGISEGAERTRWHRLRTRLLREAMARPHIAVELQKSEQERQ